MRPPLSNLATRQLTASFSWAELGTAQPQLVFGSFLFFHVKSLHFSIICTWVRGQTMLSREYLHILCANYWRVVLNYLTVCLYPLNSSNPNSRYPIPYDGHNQYRQNYTQHNPRIADTSLQLLPLLQLSQLLQLLQLQLLQLLQHHWTSKHTNSSW